MGSLAGIEGGCECVPHDPTTAALENQNSLPDEREEKHPASISGCSSFFSFLTGFPTEEWGDERGGLL